MKDNHQLLDAATRERCIQVEQEIKDFASKAIDPTRDLEGMFFKPIMDQAISYSRRFTDQADSIKGLLLSGHLAPAAIVARSLIETVAMGCLFVDEIKNILEKKNTEELEAALKRYSAGQINSEIAPIPTSEALIYLEHLDAEYISHLELKHGEFSDALTALRSQGVKLSPQKMYERMSITNTYARLNELAHPNGLGTHFIYRDDKESMRISSSFEFSCAISIWQGHHLARALRETYRFVDMLRRLS